MESQTVKQLREIAKQRGIRGYYSMNKTSLINALSSSQPPPLVGLDAWADEQLAKPAKQVTSTWSEWWTDHVPIPSGFYEWADEQLAKPIKRAISTTYDWIKNNVPQPVKKVIDSGFYAFKSKISKIFKNTKPNFEIKETKSAIKGVTKQYTIEGHNGVDPSTFLNAVKQQVVNLLSRNRQTKVNIVLTCVMERVDIKSGEVIEAEVPFTTKAEVVLESTDLSELYARATDKILETIATFQMQGSNWRFKAVVRMDINTFVYKPLKGSSYIPLPNELAAKKAIINMKNEDNECFKWCIARSLNPVNSHPERVTKELKKQAEKLNWNGITFPMTLNEIDKFERNNTNVSVHVFGYEKSVYPLRISKNNEREHVVDLLLISNDSTNHYCLIKNLRGLLRTQNCDQHMHYCRRCLNSYRDEKSLIKHATYCNQHEAVRPELPKPGTTLTFKNHNRSMRVPFIVYADFESFIKPIDTCQPDPSTSYTKQYQKHTPSSFCYHIKCFDDNVYSQDPVMFTAESEADDVAQKFFVTLEANIKEIYNQFKLPKRMMITAEDARRFNEAKVCHICEKELGSDRVRDHCHLSGRFRGAAHESCNLNYQIPKFFPVVFHNLSGYDSHLFIKKLAGGKINCIPNNEEKYISFSREVIVDEFVNKEGKPVQVKRELRFIDSFRFMASSLDALSKNLSKEQCKNIGSKYSGKQLDLLLRKGVYPYDYVDSMAVLSETKLPPKDVFYSRLTDTGISDEDYSHAQIVWREFGCKTFRDYHDLYNVSDVLLLADVFENFRDVCMKNYKLDPAWYYTSPGLAWDAALKLTNVELELLSDYEMVLMIKHGIRGGISTISNRFAHANNKYMGEAFEPSKPSSFITYLDANNLYGWAMSRPLPTSGFKWMSDNELCNWKKIAAEDGVGCILEADLEYPKELHECHNDYPLAPESIKLEGSAVPKLIPNLSDKQHYVVHYKNLKLYESLGIKVSKIHRGIRFEESAWLKEYIDLNTSLRTKASNDFEKDFFKLMNNSVFGKTMENIENRVDVRLVCDEKEAIKLAAKPNYDRRTIFDENLIAVHMKKTKLVYNKPIYLGMCILDLSKTLMYDFHYRYIKNKYGDRAKLLFTDTDSLAYELKTEDFYSDIASDVESRFDTSEYPKDHPSVSEAGFKSGINKKVIGMFKDEASGKQIEEFVGLRAKLYSYKVLGEEHKKCKGVKKNVVKNSITHDDYKDCLFTKREHIRRMNVIRSHLHDIYTEEVNKIALSADDDKRVIMEDGIHTFAHGHWKLQLSN